jgi:hypothetical protein
VRFGEISRSGHATRVGGTRLDVVGTSRDDDVELRASWTPLGVDLRPHGEAFCSLVASAAGLPPVGSLPLAKRLV